MRRLMAMLRGRPSSGQSASGSEGQPPVDIAPVIEAGRQEVRAGWRRHLNVLAKSSKANDAADGAVSEAFATADRVAKL